MRWKFLFLFMISILTFIQTSHAAPPEFTEDSEGLHIRATVPLSSPKLGFSNLTLRTIRQEDVLKTDGMPGPFSVLRADAEQMQYYVGGPKPLAQTQKSYDILWGFRLKTRPYNPSTIYILEHPEKSQFIGYIGIGSQSPTKWIFFGGLEKEFQHCGILTSLSQYLLKEFIPALRENPLTGDLARNYEEIIVTMGAENPLAQRTLKTMEKFSREMKFSITYTGPEEGKTVHVEREEHMWSINLKTLYASQGTDVAPL